MIFKCFSRAQAVRAQNLHRSTASSSAAAANNTFAEPEPPNLTNPRRVKKLTKFFGEDPPLMRLFLRTLGYEVMKENKTTTFFYENSPMKNISIFLVCFILHLINCFVEFCRNTQIYLNRNVLE